MNNLEFSDIIKITINARVGSNLDDCIKEALKLASQEWAPVIILHNSFEYFVHPGNITNMIIETKEAQAKDAEVGLSRRPAFINAIQLTLNCLKDKKERMTKHST